MSPLALPRRAVLAIEAVVDIAWHGSDAPVRSADLTARQGIPLRTLEQVLQELVRAGILAATRGPRGGYRLARERRSISLADILAAVVDTTAGTEDSATQSALGSAVVAPALQDLRAAIEEKLAAITVARLCADAARQHLPRGGDGAIDYTI